MDSHLDDEHPWETHIPADTSQQEFPRICSDQGTPEPEQILLRCTPDPGRDEAPCLASWLGEGQWLLWRTPRSLTLAHTSLHIRCSEPRCVAWTRGWGCPYGSNFPCILSTFPFPCKGRRPFLYHTCCSCSGDSCTSKLILKCMFHLEGLFLC